MSAYKNLSVIREGCLREKGGVSDLIKGRSNTVNYSVKVP